VKLVLWNYAGIDTLAKLAARYARAAELYEGLSEELEAENKKMSEVFKKRQRLITMDVRKSTTNGRRKYQENESFAKNNSQLEKEVKGLWKDVTWHVLVRCSSSKKY